MKKKFLYFFTFFSFSIKSEPVLIDRGEAVLFTEEGSVIVTKSDVERLSLEGSPRAIDEVIMEQLMLQEAKKYKIDVDENAINRYIASIQQEHGISLNDLKAMFAAAGYTYEEGREQIGVLFVVNSLLDFKVKSRLIVPEKDVREYYDAHPVIEEAKYKFARAVVPFDSSMDNGEQLDKLKKELNLGMEDFFGKSFWYKKSDIAEDKHFIFSMKPGQISEPKKLDNGFELIKLVEYKPEQLVSFEDRYSEIADILRRPRYEQLFKEFQEDLLEASSVVRF